MAGQAAIDVIIPSIVSDVSTVLGGYHMSYIFRNGEVNFWRNSTVDYGSSRGCLIEVIAL